MIDLHYWTTPNGHKITMFLEEAGLAYKIVPVNIGKGEQFKPEFLTISPNNRMPAIVDHEPADGGAPISVFESGAILLYLAEKTGKFLPADLRGRVRDARSGCSGRWAGSGRWRAEPSLHALRAGEDPLRDRPLRQRDQPALRRARTSGSPTATSSPATTRSPTWRAIRGSCRTSGRARSSRTSRNLKRWFEAIKARPATVKAYELAKSINTAAEHHRRVSARSCSARPPLSYAERIGRSP